MNSNNKKITFIHLLNDYSGSPLVLSNVIRGLQNRGFDCTVMTSDHSEGFLSDLDGVRQVPINYKFYNNQLLRLLMFFWTQMVLFFKTLYKIPAGSTIYINTLLPFGAALAGKLRGNRVIYHVHETSLKPKILKGFLKSVANWTSSTAIYVSKYLQSTEGLENHEGKTIYNALSGLFTQKADQHRILEKTNDCEFQVLMLCSLKAYKGVREFVKLSNMLPSIDFCMVINANQQDIDDYFSGQQLPQNLKLHSSQSDVHPFYQNADLVLNLSHPEQWVETFGMTILEGMYYGLPCIAPPVGGPAEIVKDEVNGYLIDQRNLTEIASKIEALANDPTLYQRLSQNARRRTMDFSIDRAITEIELLL